MSSNTGQTNKALDRLKAANAEHIEKIEKAQAPTAVTIPYDRRMEEIELLKEASSFQPTLYTMIRQLATARDLENYLNQITATEEAYLQRMSKDFTTKSQQMINQMKAISEQDGKNRERFISDCSSALKAERDKLREELERLRRRVRRILIATSITATALSALVSYLLCRVLA